MGLMVAGAALPLAAAAGALRDPAGDVRRSLPGALLILAGSAGIAVRSAPAVGAVGLVPVLGAAAGVVAAWWALVLGGRLLNARRPPATPGRPSQIRPGGAAALLVGALVVAVAPSAALVMGGMVLAAIGAELTLLPSGRHVPMLFLITLALLPALWLLYTVAGPIGLATATLGEVPLSPAASRLLALPLGLVAWAWMGLWPLHGVVRSVLVAPLGAALWLRVGLPVSSEGLAHWQPLFAALAVVGLWHAAGTGRLPSAFVALALLALASLGPYSSAAAGLLLAAALGLSLPVASTPRARVAINLVRRLALGVSAGGAGLAFATGLRAEVVLTVLSAAGLAYGYHAAAPVEDPVIPS